MRQFYRVFNELPFLRERMNCESTRDFSFSSSMHFSWGTASLSLKCHGAYMTPLRLQINSCSSLLTLSPMASLRCDRHQHEQKRPLQETHVKLLLSKATAVHLQATVWSVAHPRGIKRFIAHLEVGAVVEGDAAVARHHCAHSRMQHLQNVVGVRDSSRTLLHRSPP